MKEEFVSFLWKYQLFSHTDLNTVDQQKIKIISPGYLNQDSGPDFKEGKIEIDGILWNGAVELHLKSSDWYVHGHQNDDNYDNVILHVVWHYDKDIVRKDKSIIPTLELQNLADQNLIENYLGLENSILDIPCSNNLHEVEQIQIFNMLDRVPVERLERKTIRILKESEEHFHDWEEQCFKTLGNYFGFRLNNQNFHQLVRSISYKQIRSLHKDQLSLEAMLFGQAGILELSLKDEYFQSLKQNFYILKKKYSLGDQLKWQTWKFNRTRPANFPTIRLAQLATLLAASNRLFEYFIYSDYKELLQWLKVPVSSYWKNHYHFGKKAKSNWTGNLGKSSLQSILINVVVPLRFAYGKYIDNESIKNSALDLLNQVKPESNSITKKWISLGIKPENAYYSQGMIELYNSYCIEKRCLSCSIGSTVIKRS